MVAILPAVGHVDFKDIKEDTLCGILITNEKLACHTKAHEPTYTFWVKEQFEQDEIFLFGHFNLSTNECTCNFT